MTREEHIDELKRYLKGISKCMVPASSLYWKWHYEEVIKALEQEPKTGHRVSGDLLGGLYCSECMTCLKDYFKYCPNCGAKMAETEDK